MLSYILLLAIIAQRVIQHLTFNIIYNTHSTPS